MNGYLLVKNKQNHFDLPRKILKLNVMIDDALNKLKKENYEYKEKLLKELLANYNDAKEKYLQFDQFYSDFNLDKFIEKSFADELTRYT